MSEVKAALCAAMNEPDNVAIDHIDAVNYGLAQGIFGGGALLAKIKALLQKFGPVLVADIPAIEADIAAGNYLGAIILIITALSNSGTSV